MALHGGSADVKVLIFRIDCGDSHTMHRFASERGYKDFFDVRHDSAQTHLYGTIKGNVARKM